MEFEVGKDELWTIVAVPPELSAAADARERSELSKARTTRAAENVMDGAPDVAVKVVVNLSHPVAVKVETGRASHTIPFGAKPLPDGFVRIFKNICGKGFPYDGQQAAPVTEAANWVVAAV